MADQTAPPTDPTAARDRAYQVAQAGIAVARLAYSPDEWNDCLAAAAVLASLQANPEVLRALAGSPAAPVEVCQECGHSGPHEPSPQVRPDQVECANHCGSWVRADADPAVTWALDFWQRKYRDAVAGAPTADAAELDRLRRIERAARSGMFDRPSAPGRDELRALLTGAPEGVDAAGERDGDIAGES